MYFTGWVISSLIVPPIADKIGRKLPLFASMVFQTAMSFLVFFSRDIKVTIVLYGAIGLCAGGRVSISTTYMNEFVM